MEQQALNCGAMCVIVSGLVYHTVLPELGRAQATEYTTPSPKLGRNLRHSYFKAIHDADDDNDHDEDENQAENNVEQ